MKKYLQNKMNNEKGMTLIELLAVIVIIAIIAAIAIPAIGNIIENSRYSAVKSDALNVISAAQIYYTENATATSVTVTQLEDDGYLETSGSLVSENTVAKPSTGGLALTTADPIVYSGEKSVTFTGATVNGINADNQKGSDETISNITE
ncbi:putative Tfp assembly type protein [Planococcus antarcticus DSM 14505]|uniref:Tfp assembly type protein n=1 Tax=Planococcus antarcticus DSM 14505 TaxID=1185653 RepID=A0AA87INX5_9BACL|nr:prepilin-type N-terminal cleavage/methylation domain-containing protein [Planococcus antarcticus]EIM07954.1 putative Tfp assembly type protein [Planococcus antarcticus DSM 14505]